LAFGPAVGVALHLDWVDFAVWAALVRDLVSGGGFEAAHMAVPVRMVAGWVEVVLH
jgi:hypothetical protein